MTLRWLVLDFNAFFAACEMAEDPSLRGRPVAIVPSLTDSTCAIAANYAAKKYGIKTGTAVFDCKLRCPDIVLRVARHKLYVQYHHRLLTAIADCVPIAEVMSIDEVACTLMANECDEATARALALDIKRALAERVSPLLTASIGIAPTKLLAKLASDMQKPDGLTILQTADLPERVAHLELQDFCGIGHGMAARLQQSGIHTVADLYAQSRVAFAEIWGGITGERFYDAIHGIEPDHPGSETRSIGHQHVLEPELRNRRGAERFARFLLNKAAQRLRQTPFACQTLTVQMKCQRPFGYWEQAASFPATDLTQDLLRVFTQVWRHAPDAPPLRIGVTLSGFVPRQGVQLSLFTPRARPQQLRAGLCTALDHINRRYGAGTIGLGGIRPNFRDVNGRIAFTRVPTMEDF